MHEIEIRGETIRHVRPAAPTYMLEELERRRFAIEARPPLCDVLAARGGETASAKR